MNSPAQSQYHTYHGLITSSSSGTVVVPDILYIQGGLYILVTPDTSEERAASLTIYGLNYLTLLAWSKKLSLVVYGLQIY